MSDLGKKADNKSEEWSGKTKEFVGDKTGNKDLEAEGRGEQASSGVKQAGQKVKDAAKNVKDGLSGN
ncbi:MAG: CsbD family protein [Brachybacterium sp.]|nr:CsbD family protein [Brachybacterium sp.]